MAMRNYSLSKSNLNKEKSFFCRFAVTLLLIICLDKNALNASLLKLVNNKLPFCLGAATFVNEFYATKSY